MNSIVIKIREDEEYIKLGQALKKAGLVSSGVEAKIVINDGLVKVNGEVDTRRGKKLYSGDTFEYNDTVVKVEE
ncbi:MAG: RNA-binding S4 domain-containing protein [Eubacterium sp.]|nr:RNA-binding S4 domain-containing protein [Eubacterium sp.]